MSSRALGLFACCAVVAAVAMLYTDYFELSFLLLLVAAAAVVLALGRARPARAALVLGVVAVVGGGGWTAVRVAEGVDERRIEFRGKLDVEELVSVHTGSSDGRFIPRPGVAYLESARGTATAAHVDGGRVAFWAVVELAPWAVAAAVLLLLLPLLRAADRGDPFAVDAAGRLRLVGSVLLVGVPALAFLHFVLAEFGSDGGAVNPFVEPQWTVSVMQLLPGVLVLVLAELFRHGAELRELERRTV